MNLPKLLFVSIAFPPKSDPECIQTGRYYNALKSTNSFDIQVLTSSSPTLFMGEDESLSKYLTANDTIVNIKINEWKLVNWFLRKVVPDGIDWPDSKFFFHKKWKQAARKVDKPAVIYSRSFPLSSTIMAYKLASHFKVPWVLHLSDPWSISPIHTRSKKNQAYQQKWEVKCFEKASCICLTSEATIKAYQKLYPELTNKFTLVPNVPFEHKNNRPVDFSNKLKITYTGGLAGLRSPRIFIEALETLIKNNSDFENRLEIIFAGNIDRSIKKIFSETTLTCISYIGNVSLNKSINLQQSSHILLSIDNPIAKAEQAMFIPSKIFDYINNNRRVLALTTKNSATETFLNKFKADILTLESVKQIQSILETYLIKFKQKDKVFFQQEINLPEEYGIKYNVNKLCNLLNDSIKKHHG